MAWPLQDILVVKPKTAYEIETGVKNGYKIDETEDMIKRYEKEGYAAYVIVPNAEVKEKYRKAGFCGIGSVEIYNPYRGYVFYEPHGAHFTLVLRFNISNNLYNYRQEASINNISISNGESYLSDVVGYSTSTLHIGITYVYVNVDVIGSSFSGLVDLSIEVQ